MPKLASLIVDIRSNTAKFTQGMASAQKSMGKFAKSANALKGAMLTLGGLAGIGFVIKKNLELADSIGKAADTVALSTDAYQELGQAAERAGVQQSQFTSNMTAFVKRVGEARANTGPLVSFLKKYDEQLLSAIQNTKTQEEAFNLVADAMQRATTETDRAALANAAFSRAGVQMTILMKNGAAGVDEMRQRVRELGTVIEEDFIRNAEAANDRVDELSRVISRKLTVAVAENAETIETLAEAIIGLVGALGDGVTSLNKFGAAIGTNIADSLSDSDIARYALLEQSLERVNLNIANQGDLVSDFQLGAWQTQAEAYKQQLEEINSKRQEVGLSGLGGEGGEQKKESTLSEVVAEQRETELVETQEHKDKLTQIENDHWAKIDQIRRQNMTALQKFNEMNWKDQTQTVIGAMVDMTQGVAQSSKTMFNINKVAATAEAIIAGYKGIALTLGSYPYPINIGMAALSAAASFAQVSAIQGTSYGGGGSAPSLAGAGGGSETINTVDVTGASADTTQTSTLTVNLGDFDVAALPQTTLRTLLTQIEDARSDMGDNTQVIYV